jgi:methyl-accepting chemotaxis protein
MLRSIRTPLAIAFAAMTLVLLVVAGSSIANLEALEDLSAEVDRTWVPRLNAAHTLAEKLGEARIAEAVMVMAIDNLERTNGEAEMIKASAAVDAALATLRQTAHSAEDEALIDRLTKQWVAQREVSEEVTRLAGAIFGNSAVDLFSKAGRDTFTATSASVEKLVALTVRGATRAAARAQATADQAKLWALVCGALGALVAALATAYVFKGLAAALRRLAATTHRIGAGELDIAVPGTGRRDELGTMAVAVDALRQAAIERLRLEGETTRTREGIERRQRTVETAVAAFRGKLGEILQGLAHNADTMQSAAATMTVAAETADAEAHAASQASQESASNVNSIAAAAEEMSASINEIGGQIARTAQAVLSAHQLTEGADAQMGELTVAAEKIGAIVDLISQVAGQTNLLALNATIEAARAGEAGRGFAVVASEVKSLAIQTTRATEEIAASIRDIQSATGRAAAIMRDTTDQMREVQSLTTAIASAVEQQDATTRIISHTVADAAVGTERLAENVASASRSISSTRDTAQHVTGAAADVARQTERLQREAEAFLRSVAA